MQAQKNNSRKRGVRASRAKLNEALIRAGLKSQRELAERIADIERLDSPPKDLVNRVFRGVAVEPATLERVARALGIQAYSIYLTDGENGPDGVESPALDTPAHGSCAPLNTAVRARSRPPALRAAGGFIGLALVLALAVLWRLSADMPLRCGASEFFHPIHADESRLGIVVARFAKDPDNIAQHVLAMTFADDARLDPYVSVLQTCHVLSLDHPGDVGSRRRALRTRGRKLLQDSGALVLLWGRVQRNNIEVRFISTRADEAPPTIKVQGKSLSVQEPRLRVPVYLSEPSGALPKLKTIVLTLMQPKNRSQTRMLAKAINRYHESRRSALKPVSSVRRAQPARPR